MYGEMSERGGWPVGWRPEQLGAHCFAQGHLGSAQKVNWHLSSYQSAFHTDWFELDLNRRILEI